MVSEVVYKSGSDQIDFLYFHDAGTDRQDGNSIAYDYADGLLSGIRFFGLEGTYPALFYASDSFTFNKAGELLSCSLNNQTPGLGTDYVFTLDGKINPIQLGLEDVFIPASVSSGNVVQQSITSNGVTNKNSSNLIYRNDNRPLSAVSIDEKGIISAHVHYFYQ